MEQVKALHESTGPAIGKILLPTLNIFCPLLQKNKAAIFSVPRTTESYGSHPRQKLDIYLPPQSSDESPILVFVYGGGLVGGDKIVPLVPGSLMYHNLGAFFAKHGFRTIIPDYRRVNSERGGEDAVFPSGGEDISLVMKWLEGFVSKGKKTDVFVMGNSAGGLHLCTFLFEPRFLEQRKEMVTGEKGVVLKGFINLSVPHHFQTATAERSDMLQKYFGSKSDVAAHCPCGLLSAAIKTGKSKQDLGIPRTLVLVNEFDPPNEITDSVKDFMDLWKTNWGEEGLVFEMIPGHNHISTPPALMSGEGDEWGEDVVKWMKGPSS